MSRSMPLALDGLVGILLCDEIKHELSPSCLFCSVQKTGAQQGAFFIFPYLEMYSSHATLGVTSSAGAIPPIRSYKL